MSGPGPTADELDTILTIGSRVPDHGKLSPWRFIVFEGEAKARAARRLSELAAVRPDTVKAQAALGKFTVPPLSVCVVSHVKPGDIPEWEQILSSAGVCLTLVN